MLACDGQSSNRGDPIVVHRGSRWTEPDRRVFRRRRYRLGPPAQLVEASAVWRPGRDAQGCANFPARRISANVTRPSSLSPLPHCFLAVRRHTGNGALRYAALGECREPGHRLWRTFWIIGLGWDQTSCGFGFMIFGTAMRRSSCSPECILKSPKSGSGIRPRPRPRPLQPRNGRDAGGCRRPSRRRVSGCYKSDRRAETKPSDVSRNIVR